MTDKTPNLNLNKPSRGDRRWDKPLIENFEILDGKLKEHADLIDSLQGTVGIGSATVPKRQTVLQGPYSAEGSPNLLKGKWSSNLCVGGTALAYNYYDASRTPAHAFNGNNGDVWHSGTTTLDQIMWIGYRFTRARHIRRIRLNQYDDGTSNYQVSSVYVESSVDGANWTVVAIVDVWGDKTFVLPESSPAAYWRLRANSGSTNGWWAVREIEMYELNYGGHPFYTKNVFVSALPVMTSNTTPSGRAFASSVYSNSSWGEPYLAFDSNTSTGWHSNLGYTYPHYLGYDFGTLKKIVRYAINCRPNVLNQAPTTWELQGWNGSQWVNLDTRTEVSWTMGQRQVFDVANPGFYTKYQLSITANNGDTNQIVSIPSFELFEHKEVVKTNLCFAGNPISSGDYSGQPASSAFDGKATTYWRSAATSSTLNQWLGYDFGEYSHEVRVIKIHHGPNRSDLAEQILVQYSDEGTTWSDAALFNLTYNVQNVHWLVLPAVGSHRFWRLVSPKIHYTEGHWAVYEVEMYDSLDVCEFAGTNQSGPNLIPVMSSNNSPSGVAEASSVRDAGYEPWRAFDNTTGYWASQTLPAWLSYDFGADTVVNRYVIGGSPVGTYSPSAWTLQGWDGSTWTVIDTQTGVTWGNYERKVFDLKAEVTYSKYKLDVTTTADNRYVEILDLELYSSPKPTLKAFFSSDVDVFLSFAKGSANGVKIDAVSRVSPGVESTILLPPNSTSYLYVERGGFNSLSYGSTLNAPIYSYNSPRFYNSTDVTSASYAFGRNSSNVDNSTTNSTNPASAAFDNNLSSGGGAWANPGGMNNKIGQLFPTPRGIRKVRILPYAASGNYSPYRWYVAASNDGITWIKVPITEWLANCSPYNEDEAATISGSGWLEVALEDVGAYKYWAVHVYDYFGSGWNSTPLVEIEMFEEVSPPTDQSWFDLSKMEMKVFNGSQWVKKERLFLGEAVTTESVSSIVTYAYNGAHDTGWFNVAANTTYVKNHNIGVPYPKIVSFLASKPDGSGPVVDTNHGGSLKGLSNPTNLQIRTGSTPYIERGVFSTTTAQYRLILERGF